MTTTLSVPRPAASRPDPSAFPTFAAQVTARFTWLSQHELFTTDCASALFDTYLAAFPPGTNPLFRTQTEHHCRCCASFIQQLGGLVAIVDGQVQTVWDIPDAPAPYNTVTGRLAATVRAATITGFFRTAETQYGRHSNTDAHDDRITWHHFHGTIAPHHRSSSPSADAARLNAVRRVLERGLNEVTTEHFETVLDLISSNNLYRGPEFLGPICAFQSLHTNYQAAPDPDLFLWANSGNSAAGFRNTVIGTLFTDLADGDPPELAVTKFEAKVAPTNYKRPKAVVTTRQIDTALAQLQALGLQDAIHRRYATLSDLSVNDVLYVNRTAAPLMRDPVRDLLLDAARSTPTPPANPKAPPTPINICDLLQLGAQEIQLTLTPEHFPNLVSLTAPVHTNVPPILLWDNNFAWSYAGDVTDSIKARVAKAGGNVKAALRCSLAWHNLDDLDIHAFGPEGHIYFGNRRNILDVDMNVSNPVRDAVENLSWTRPRNGAYRIGVHNYTPRETTNPGFTLQLECDGRLQEFNHPGLLRGHFNALDFRIVDGQLTDLQVSPDLIAGQSQPLKEWGITTHQPTTVTSILLSPNHWEGACGRGNRHWFFLLDGCINPESTRGFYNEFLRPELATHRRVFETLGSKMRCPPSTDQLSGVGFSETKTASVQVHADRRPFQLQF